METTHQMTVEGARQPAQAELRMLAAITASTARDAVLKGEQRVRFRGFRIAARCIPRADGRAPMVELTIDDGALMPLVLRAPVMADLRDEQIFSG